MLSNLGSKFSLWKSLVLAVTLGVVLSSSASAERIRKSDCKINGFAMYGKIQVVDKFPDVKVKVVNTMPDLKVKIVPRFANKCGEWQMVDKFPDVRVQFVERFPDVTIQYVQKFPGVN